LTPLTAFSIAVEQLQPGATGSQIAALLDHRAKRTLVLEWKAGRCHPPAWALDLLASKLLTHGAAFTDVAERIKMIPERPGLKAGARNLAEWRVKKAREG
jgi:hypothetical protein